MRIIRMGMGLCVAFAIGCTQLEATGNITTPVPAGPPAGSEATPAADSVAAPAAPAGGFDFEGDEQPEVGEIEPNEGGEVILQNAADPDVGEEPAADPLVVVGEPIPLGEEPPAVDNEPVYAWDPETAPPATWGVRVLSTVNNTLPPRAVIGLPDGTEEVVQPGAMLPDQSLIVMAIGKDVVEFAQVVPDGVQARVETQIVKALFPQ